MFQNRFKTTRTLLTALFNVTKTQEASKTEYTIEKNEAFWVGQIKDKHLRVLNSKGEQEGWVPFFVNGKPSCFKAIYFEGATVGLRKGREIGVGSDRKYLRKGTRGTIKDTRWIEDNLFACVAFEGVKEPALLSTKALMTNDELEQFRIKVAKEWEAKCHMEPKILNMEELRPIIIYEDEELKKKIKIKGSNFLKFIPATIKQVAIDYRGEFGNVDDIMLSLICEGFTKHYYVKRIDRKGRDNDDLLMQYLRQYNGFVRIYKHSKNSKKITKIIGEDDFQPMDYKELVEKNEVRIISKKANKHGLWTIRYGEQKGLISHASKERLSRQIRRKKQRRRRLLRQRLAIEERFTTV